MVDADDGDFWMSFEDLTVHFIGVNVCKCRHPSISNKSWNEVRPA
jgi:hypothetical protein